MEYRFFATTALPRQRVGLLSVLFSRRVGDILDDKMGGKNLEKNAFNGWFGVVETPKRNRPFHRFGAALARLFWLSAAPFY